jgi:hypothetical protein
VLFSGLRCAALWSGILVADYNYGNLLFRSQALAGFWNGSLPYLWAIIFIEFI